MNILVISDYFYDLKHLATSEIDFRKWNQYFPLSLGGYDAILVDMTFKSKRKLHSNQFKLLNDLKAKFEKPGFLSKNNLIVVVVCGSPNISLEIDVPYDPNDIDTIYDPEVFSSYDYLKPILPEFTERVVFEEGRHVYPVSTVPVNFYLDEYRNEPTFLYYDYDPDSEKCRDITPLAKMKEKGNACVAFECRLGKGLVSILTSYDSKRKEKSFLFLLRICKSYHKRNEHIKEFTMLDELIPDEAVRRDFVEALSCFNYDLYTATVLMCRRALDTSISKEETTDSNKFLRTRVNKLYEEGIIHSQLRNIAIEIIEFGNWGAHPGIYLNKQIDEGDAKNVIDFIKYYFEYFHRLREKLRISEERRAELKGKEGK